jgi:hypothetical protein
MLQAYTFYTNTVTTLCFQTHSDIFINRCLSYATKAIATEQKYKQTATGNGNKYKVNQIMYWADIMTEA